MHVIFNQVDVNQIKLIVSHESAKEAWNILQTIYEGTNDIKRFRLLMLTARLSEDQSLTDFYGYLMHTYIFLL